MFDARKVLKRSIYLATPPSAICFLNDLGDLLVVRRRNTRGMGGGRLQFKGAG